MPPNHNYVKFKKLAYSPQYTEAALEAALLWFRSVENEVTKKPVLEYFNSLGNFALFKPDGTNGFQYLNQACHYYLSARDNTTKDVDCVTLWCKTEAHDEWLTWYDWFCNRSFASQFIIGKTPEGVVVSSDIPASLMHFIAMVSRVTRMFPKENFQSFNKLVSNGVPEEVAYMTCFCVGRGKSSSAFTPSKDHRPFSCPSLMGMKRFISGEFHIYNETQLYRHFRDMNCSHFIPAGRLTSDVVTNEELMKLIMDRRQASDGGVYKPPNPFVKQQKGLRHEEFSYSEIYEIVLPYYTEKGEFNVEA